MNAITYGNDRLAEAEKLEKSVMGADRRARFWDRIAERYAKRPVADQAAYQKKLEITREYFRPDMEVLELGCGTGSTAIEHARWVKHIRAVDISSKMLEIARRKAADKGVRNVTFERSAADDMDVPDHSVDMVLAHSLLHLLENEQQMIASVHCMLKPGGIFVSSTACLGDNMNWFRFIAPIGRVLGLIPRVQFFTVEELRNSLVKAGFEIEHQWRPGKNKAVFVVARKAA